MTPQELAERWVAGDRWVRRDLRTHPDPAQVTAETLLLLIENDGMKYARSLTVALSVDLAVSKLGKPR